MTSRAVPPLLQPYLAPPDPGSESLTLVTSVLGASANWLVLRYLVSCLATRQSQSQAPQLPRSESPNVSSSSTSQRTSNDGGSGMRTNVATTVVLVSFLRDLTFWKSSASKLGLDLVAMGKKGRFFFVDGMAGSFPVAAETTKTADTGWHAHFGPLDAKKSGIQGGKNEEEQGLEKVVSRVLSQVKALGNGNVVLILDGLDFFQAATEETSGVIEDVVMSWRQKTSSLLITLHTDDPLVHSQTTQLEKHHASLVLSLAHSADLVLACRMLDTGGASDVSGVIRITPGGGSGGDDWGVVEREQENERAMEKELLYFVNSDGSAKVFERGS